MTEPAPGSTGSLLSRWREVRLNVLLFVLTCASVLMAGAYHVYGIAESAGAPTLVDLGRAVLGAGPAAAAWSFAAPLLGILLAHEFGHYLAARYHGVPASLPYFIPLPIPGGLGTMGAVIAMPERIRSRDALLDIGAAGPIAGLVVAVPVLIYGIAQSEVSPYPVEGYTQEGQSLFYVFIKWLVHGRIPEGSDVFLHPTAYAGWAGLFLTMINLLPFGQLDGGHIAYALFGQKQDRAAPWFRRALLLLFAYNAFIFIGPVVRGASELSLMEAIANSLFWLIWYLFLGVIARVGGRDHPPFEPGPLSPGRRALAWLSLGLFLALFMPTPHAIVR